MVHPELTGARAGGQSLPRCALLRSGAPAPLAPLPSLSHQYAPKALEARGGHKLIQVTRGDTWWYVMAYDDTPNASRAHTPRLPRAIDRDVADSRLTHPANAIVILIPRMLQ